MKTHKFTMLFVLTLTLLTTMAGLSTAAPLAAMPGQQSEADTPPTVLETIPAAGAEHPLEEPIRLTFDQPMDQASVEAAFTIEPGDTADGTFDWPTPSSLTFQFSDGFERGQRYTVRLAATAESETGLTMNRPFSLRFTGVGFLDVTNVQPADGDVEIMPETVVTVAFNRPVVPLREIGSTSKTSGILEFEPPVDGRGEWLNTSIYQFTPLGDGFEPATDYTARVVAGLTDALDQAVLAAAYEWQFTTLTPAAIGSLPMQGDLYVSPTPVISLTFNQPMNRRSVEQNLSLVNEATGEAVSVTDFTWSASGLTLPQDDQPSNYYDYEYDPGAGPSEIGLETVAFSPAEPLELATDYTLSLPAGTAGQLSGTATADDYTATFTTIDAPAVVSTTPADGDQFVNDYNMFNIQIIFSAPMNPQSLSFGDNLRLEMSVGGTDPPVMITPTRVFSYWSNSDMELSINYPAQFNSSYTLTIQGDIEGRYGQPLGETTEVSWQTLNQSPAIRFLSPRVATYNAYDASRLYLTVRNLSEARFALYRIPEEDFLDLTGNNWYDRWEGYQPPEANLVRRWTMETDPEAFKNYVYELSVTEDPDQPLEPGFYYLAGSPGEIFPAARSVPFDGSQARVILAVSQYQVTLKKSLSTSLVWVTDLQSGQPVADLPVTLKLQPWQGSLQEIGTATTDDEGVAFLEYETLSQQEDGFFYALVGDTAEPDEAFGVALNNWENGIQRLDYNGVQTEDWTPPYNGVVYTERNIYRPGQTVYFKGIVRADNDAAYQVPPSGTTVEVILNDAQFNEIYKERLPLNEMGSFNGFFELGEEASLGNYTLSANLNQQSYFSHNFNVAAYRKPEFLVNVTADKPEYAQGEIIQVVAETEYFAGGPVYNAEVQWVVLSDEYQFNYARQGSYDFTDSETFYGSPYSWSPGFGEQLATGVGTTDRNGRLTFEVPADIADQRTSRQFIIEVTVMGLNNQTVTGRTQVVVHKGHLYVGLRPTRFIGTAGDPSEIELIVVDWDSQPVANQEVELIFARQQWYSVQRQDPEPPRTGQSGDSFYWENLAETVAVFTTTATTGADGLATASFTPDQGGSYKIYARTIDEDDRQIFSSTFLWVSGGGYINWGQGNDDRMQLVADQAEYQVGDTAEVLVPHPYSGTVQALVTLERGNIYSYSVVTLESNSDQLAIPIEESLIPNMYVSVVAVQGSGASQPSHLVSAADRQLPSFKVGYVNLPIAPAEKQLEIVMTPSDPENETYQPDDTVAFDIQVTNQGEPVEAELSLALIDKAILTLAPLESGYLLDTFWRERGLGVQTGSSLTLAIDRVNQVIDAKKGGGGGGGPEGIDTIREQFADVPLWEAAFRTAEDGTGTVEVTLPDNLTTWVLVGKGVTGDDTLVGESRTEIVSTKPLLVRPVVPRFFVVGDEARIGLIIQNQTDQDLNVLPYLQAEGLTVEPVNDTDGVAVGAGEQVKVEYNVTVPPALPTTTVEAAEGMTDDTGQTIVTLIMSASTNDLQDRLTLKLPVYSFSSPETVATVGTLTEEGQQTEAIALPDSADPAQGDLTISVDPTLAAGMVDGLTFLRDYPYGSTEAIVSSFLPNVMTYRANQTLNTNRGQRPDSVNQAVQRLYRFQQNDGGWGWFPNDASDPFLTAYVVLGLVEAQKADFTVESTVINRAVDYLADSLMAPKDVAEPWQGNQQAFILYVLAEAEEGDFSRAAALFSQRQQLDLFGRAYLAMAMHLSDPTASQIDTLVSDITSEAINTATGTHWEEAQVDYFSMNTDTRSTAIIVAALSRIAPDNPLLPQAVRWLMTVRENGGHWETTQETAWAIIGLTDWLVASGELAADYAWSVSLNGTELGEGQVSPRNVDESVKLQVEVAKLLTDEINRLTVSRQPVTGETSHGNLYYAAYLTYFKPAAEVTAIDRGIMVSRQYSLQGDGEGNPISTAEVGQVIEVTLTLVVPQDLHYVLVADPFPAGTEAIDSSLATTSIVNEGGELLRTDRTNRWGGNQWFSHTELRDEKATLFATYLPQGTYEYTYLIRAAIPGEYHVIPTHAEEVYFPERFGRGDGQIFTITQ